jgi:microsomal dipeptidase-like Zn-dependent dipeptidase
VEGFPLLLGVLQETGFRKADLEKICWRNWFRVLKDTWHGGEA